MIKFITLQKEHLKMVLGWRVQPEVSQYLLTEVTYDLEKQHYWFERISKDNTCRYWIIVYQNIPIGLFNLAAVDQQNLNCSAGYYIGDLRYRQLGAMIPPYLYNYVFQKMKFRKIYGEVVAGNKNILKIHQMHGFRQVGVYKDHIFKNEQFYDIILIELLSEIWLEQKRYRRYVAAFD